MGFIDVSLSRSYAKLINRDISEGTLTREEVRNKGEIPVLRS